MKLNFHRKKTVTHDVRDMYQIRKTAEHNLKTINFYFEGGKWRFGEM